MKIIKTIIAIAFLNSGLLSAQSGAVSPYSYFGIGNTEDFNNSRAYGMGQTGIALSSYLYLNGRNPASLGMMAQSSFLYDFGVYGTYNVSKSASDKQNIWDGNLSNVNIGFPVTKKIGVMLGMEPVSQVKYTINSTIPIEGSSSDYPIKLYGEGGLTKVFTSAGYNVNNKLFLGGTINYLFGSIDHMEKISPGSSLVTDFTLKNSNSYQGFSFGLGAQYHQKINNNANLTIGAIYNFKSKIKQETVSTYNLYVGSTDTTTSIDTINTNARMPQEFGVGLSLDLKTNLTLTADYAVKDWKGIAYDNDTREIYQKEQIFNVGAEYRPRILHAKGPINRVMYRLGAGYSSGNYKLYGDNIDKVFVTGGVGYLIKPKFSVNVNYSMTKRGWLNDADIQDTYHMLSISFNGIENWFTKRVID